MSGREYHWIMTTRWPTSTGYGIRTLHGTVNVAPGESRHVVYLKAFDLMCEPPGDPNSNVLFFSLEPNDLAATEDGQS